MPWQLILFVFVLLVAGRIAVGLGRSGTWRWRASLVVRNRPNVARWLWTRRHVPIFRSRRIRGTADRCIRRLIDSPIVWLNVGRVLRLAVRQGALVGWRPGIRPITRRGRPVAGLHVRRPFVRRLGSRRIPRLASYRGPLVGRRAGIRPITRRWRPIARLHVRGPLVRRLGSRRALRLAIDGRPLVRWRVRRLVTRGGALVGWRAGIRPIIRRGRPVARLRI
jgi:hypothetical protein